MKKPALLGLSVFLTLSAGFLFSACQSDAAKKIGDLGPALLPNRTDTRLVEGEPADKRLILPEGFQATLFSTQAPGARDLQFSPNSTLLVSLKGQGKVIALPDKDGNGEADKTVEVLKGLKNPHGLAFHNGKLFVAEERQVTRYNWDETNMTATFDKKILDLPSGGSNHVTRSLLFDQNNNLFISIGSDCNVCNEKDNRHASVMISNENGDNPRVYAAGLRNAVFMALNPIDGTVWATENGRDMLGDDVPPDEINILQENANYGWPFCYGAQIPDNSFGGKDAAYCNTTKAPAGELQAHSAALGLTFINSPAFPADWQGDLLVAFHGSWNRSVPTGYKVVHLKVDGTQTKDQSDFMTGFIQGGQTLGRPVDLTFDTLGRLYLSDDKAGAVYLVSHTQP